MKKALMLGAMVAVVATAALAKKGGIAPSYSFYGFCDGLADLSGTTVVTGLHVYEKCGSGYTDTYIGGVESRSSTFGSGKTYGFVDSDYSAPITYVYYANITALTWALYFVSTEYAIPFEEGGSGTLTVGYNSRAVGGHKDSTVHAGMVKAGLIKK
jgi:hypothetical protein